ncbi:hybrid sensor histidine kinase/response regulator [Leptospira sp. GIMC2001]|uniref:hybrid sensor histidine kinase/response regulator n=1 Tax=Leptospira sp. GIMC2001 TaxID=1513297 RepID=UPI00234A4B31|nr:response regulator [Leptospira sp. GIMC2001]WCL49823.1 response regulator [Leptospira sp. GIMC2001]
MESTVLIIDDEESIRSALNRVLSREGYVTILAETAEEGIEILEKKNVDVVISDILMKGLSGIGVIQWASERKLNIPIILITGNPDITSAGDAVRYKAFDYIPKPVQRARILEVVSNAILNKKKIDAKELELLDSKKKEFNLLLKNRDLNLQNSIILESTSDCIITIDSRGLIHSINAATLHLFGYKESEVIGSTPEFLYPERKKIRYNRLVNRFIKSSIRLVQKRLLDVEFKSRAGKIIFCDISICRYELSGERFFSAILRDNTEKRNMINNLIESERRAFLNTIAASIGHEINNALTSIMGFVELAIEPNATSVIKDRAIQITMTQGQKLRNLTANLLTLGRQEKLGWSANKKEISDLNNCVDSVLDFFEKSMRLKHCNLIVNKTNSQLNVIGNSDQLGLIISNLILNSADATYNNGNIIISTSIEEGKPILRIKDNGVGMTEEVKSKLYEPYFTTKELGKGTGLGMFVVKEISDLYDIKIDVDSHINQGTIFTLRFQAPKPPKNIPVPKA